jgi:hypothetical protein
MEAVGANCAPANSPPDNLWFIRLADWSPTSRTQPRSGGSQPADGETIFLERVDEFVEEFQANPRLGLQSLDFYPENPRRVVLWIRAGESALRAISIDNACSAKSTKLTPEKIESAEEFAFYQDSQVSQNLCEHPQVSTADAGSPLAVWTLWTNPLHPNLLHQ